ncbi:ribonuclease P protein component [Spiroplasma endosymbiont of Labia minor]|uniref:ribonuclease P protein component n=1 Tax=Spiroplasma endosymbiont of Labia minor TaxID=3066305 RepID=UPI0030CE21F3
MKNKNIIKKNIEFQSIIDKKRYQKNVSFIVYYEKNLQNYLRFGISVGKKIGNAVLRNKLKRQVRNMIYELINDIYDKSINIICIVRKQFQNQTYKENKSLLLKTLLKIN